jgi:murein L,D-transpeptidase YcbB/YkuD
MNKKYQASLLIVALSLVSAHTALASYGYGGEGSHSGGTSYEYGCTDREALNYNRLATSDDNTCKYSKEKEKEKKDKADKEKQDKIDKEKADKAKADQDKADKEKKQGDNKGSQGTKPRGEVRGASVYVFGKDLRRGVKHADVTELQKALITEGHLTIASTTNYFGPLTLAAVKKYQKAHGLPETGFVGPMTRDLLNGGNSQ